MVFEIVKTNIVNVTADAIVLPANSKLKEGSGTSTAIFQAAGRKKLTKACKDIGFCEVGSAVPTLAFDLDAEYIIHAVVPKWIDGNKGEYDILCSAYLTALKLADVMGCKTIAFPLLASGNNGFDKELAFEIAKESFESFEGYYLKKALLVIYGEPVAALVRRRGYNYIEIPEDLLRQEQKEKQDVKRKQMVENGKAIAQQALEDSIELGMDFLKKKENQKMLFNLAVKIVRIAIAKR